VTYVIGGYFWCGNRRIHVSQQPPVGRVLFGNDSEAPGFPGASFLCSN
jgi:hypothetical protein